MNISTPIENHIPLNVTVRYKQRLMAMVEVFDADLTVCLARGKEGWSVVGLEGKLIDENWHKNLPALTLAKTLEEGRGVVLAEHLGEMGGSKNSPIPYRLVSTVSTISSDNRIVFIAAKLLKKGLYQPSDIKALREFQGAFDGAGV
ncbi:MAG: hypothetical protein WC314_22545 [Vulcanimicrobiota bacterium]